VAKQRGRAPTPGPGAHGSYITPEGFERLRAEYERLWRHERPKVTREVTEAAAQGDRSENAEYIYGKKRLREIDRRLRFLSKRMDAVTVVSHTPSQAGKVFFGATVTLEDEDGTQHEYRLVGPDESDAGAGSISIESPLGRALLGREEGDSFDFVRPKGRTTFEVVAVRYVEPG
jgi:transcription elongation factor GreB